MRSVNGCERKYKTWRLEMLHPADAIRDFFPFTGIEDLDLLALLLSALPIPSLKRSPSNHSIPRKHQSSERGGAQLLVSIIHLSLSPILLRPWETMTFRGIVAKNLASSSQGIDRSRIASVPGCFDSVARNANTIVRYGFRVDRANGEVFRVGFLGTCESIENVS
jgi:hypothetical protein